MQKSQPHVLGYEEHLDCSAETVPFVLMHAVLSRLLSGLYTLL